jgi:hypothetical protein
MCPAVTEPKTMADHAHDAPVTEPPLNHELSDADPRPILKFLVFLVVITIVMAGVVGFFYNYLERREAAEKTARYPMSLLDAQRPLPPGPRLQTYPFQDIKELRQTEVPLLDSYEWIDRNAGTVRIPIERAMDVLAERGLPYRKPGQASGTPAPTAAGSQLAGAESGASAPSSGSQTSTGASSGRQPTTAHPPQ